MKKIAVDMRMMKPFPTGIGTHYLNLVHSLIENYPENKYLLIINKRCEEFIYELFSDLKVDYVNININGGTFKQYILSPILFIRFKMLGVDYLLTDPWCSFPFIPIKYALMIYDLIGFNGISRLSLKQKLFDKFVYRAVSKNANTLIASSESVRDDLKKYFNISSDKIYVVPPSVSIEYTYEINEEDLNKTLDKYNLKRNKYFVYIGNRRPHKNLEGALRAFSIYLNNSLDKSIEFVLVGGFDSENNSLEISIEDLINNEYKEIKSNIKILGKIKSNETVHEILNGSIALFHPTKFEGFGLTPLEAMYSKTAVISSNIPSIMEVVGDAGMLISPDNPDENAKALNMISTNESLRSDLIKKAEIRSKEFNWNNASKLLIKVFQN